MAISDEDIKKAAREAAISVIKPGPCVCGLGSWYAALNYREVRDTLNEENEKRFMNTLPDLQEWIDRMKNYCGITVITAQTYFQKAELSVKEGKWADAAAALRRGLWEIDKQLTNGAAKEIKETE